jgi:hypothetical protein
MGALMSVLNAVALTICFALVSAFVLLIKFLNEYYFQGNTRIDISSAIFAWGAFQVGFFLIVLIGGWLI